MKKLFLALIALLSLNIKADDQLDEITPLTPHEMTQKDAPVELRVSDIKTQVPVLMGYFISSFGSGLGSGIGTGIVRSAFSEIDKPYDFALYTTVLGQALWNNCDKEQEAARCAEIAARLNANIMRDCKTFADQQMGDGDEAMKTWVAYGLYQNMDKFQPEQFQVNNRMYSAAATILGFAAGAYVGSKIGAGMYNGCASLWNWYYPQTPVIGDNYINISHTIPKQ